MDPVYDVTDNFGAFDADGNPMGDGVLDNPGFSGIRKTKFDPEFGLDWKVVRCDQASYI